jgi:type VI secretion system secreted protein VgrG
MGRKMADSKTLMRLTTSLGGDNLRFRSLHAREELARLYAFDIQALARKPDIVTADLLGKPACVTLKLPDDSDRHFHGLVCAMGIANELEDGVEYRMVLRPWLWLLTRRSDSRVFQNMTAVDIAKEVFKPFGSDYQFELSGTLPTYAYCVQYRETDFNFISRLFEREGLYYYFKHEAGKHTLVVVNAVSAHAECSGQHEFRFRSSSDRGLDEEAITQWHSRREIQSGKWTLNDFNFEAPKTSLLQSASSEVPKAPRQLEIYDYPGDYSDARGGARYAKLRTEETDARSALIEGAGSLRTIACGYRFKLLDHPDKNENGAHLVLATEIEMGLSGYESGAGEDYFRSRFTAASCSRPFRPERITPKPVVGGPHTATVVGPSGEEIHVDKFGRVKVQFHWDRLGKRDAESSCYVRVSQGAAGSGWGMVWLPRIGHEVVVDFLEGDPDQPLITGRVFNADNLPPYVLPDHKTVSTIKSRSSKNGRAADFNEIRFEDEKGSEYLMLKASKDKFEFVTNTSSTEIGKDEHHLVKGERREKISGNAELTVEKDVIQKVGGKLGIEIAKGVMLKSGGVYALKAATDIAAESGTGYSTKAGTDMHAKAGMNISIDAGMNLHIKGGMNVVIEAGITMTLKGGAGSVVIGPDGVSITGPLVKINSGGAPGAGQGASPVKPESPDAAKAPTPPKDPLAHR